MSDGRPLSSEIRDALKACRDLRGMLDESTPFGPSRADVNVKLSDIERLLNTVLRAIAA